MPMLDIHVTVMGVGRQMGLKFAPLLFGKVSSAHRPMTIQPQLSSVRQTLGRLDHAEQLATFSFTHMQVKVKTLSRRRKIKVATDGEVSYMSNPLEFRVLDEQLLLLKPDASPVFESPPERPPAFAPGLVDIR